MKGSKEVIELMGKKSTKKNKDDIIALAGMVLLLSKGEKIDIDEYVRMLKKHNLIITDNGEIGVKGE